MSKSEQSEQARESNINSHQSVDGTIGTSSISTSSLPSSRRNIRSFRRSTKGLGYGSDHAVRKRYLYRLGIEATYGSDVHSDHDSITTCSRDSTSNTNPMMMYGLQPPSLYQSSKSSRPPRARTSSTRSSKSVEKVDKVLLRKSRQYTTELKFDKSDPTDVEKTSHHTFNTPSSPPPNDELSTAWANVLGIGETSAEPLDGAFDLFSLPSDSSIASHQRTITTKASVDSLTEASSYNSNALTFFSFKSMDRAISDINQGTMSLSDHSTLPRRKVSFDSTVKATTIPARDSYSQRVKTKLWSSSEDIVNNAIRNEFEFQFDGNDWRRIREESDFIPVAPSSDEKIHPAHFYGLPFASRSMPALHTEESSSSLERKGSSSDDDDGSDLHFCGVFGMEMNDE